MTSFEKIPPISREGLCSYSVTTITDGTKLSAHRIRWLLVLQTIRSLTRASIPNDPNYADRFIFLPVTMFVCQETDLSTANFVPCLVVVSYLYSHTGNLGV